MRIMVVYNSAFGNTEKVANTIGDALAEQASVTVRQAVQVTPLDPTGFDCLVVGSPTQKMNFTDGMRDFLAAIPEQGLAGINVAAFDTRISIDDIDSRIGRFAARVFLHRYAAEPIADALATRGGQVVVEPAGFFVLDTEGPLKEGELDRAADWARQILKHVMA